MAKIDIYQAVTDRILEMLDKGTVPWQQPFTGMGLPTNLASGKAYRGINVFLLACTAMTQGYGSAYWLTFKQARAKGGSVRKGEKSSLVVFWKKLDPRNHPRPDPDKRPGETSLDELKERFVLRYYNVFNAEQCDGIEQPDAGPTQAHDPSWFVPRDEAQWIVDHFPRPPTIRQEGAQPCYHVKEDVVRIPPPEKFTSVESYYATLFHELVHATGNKHRLDRGLDTNPAPFGSRDYSKEELIAEMGAAFLAATAGISDQTIEQSAAYIDGWRKSLKDDKKLVIQAAGAGQRAADHILGTTFADESSPQDEAEGSREKEVVGRPRDSGDAGPDLATLERVSRSLQAFPRPGQANLNSTATSEQRSAYISAVLGWWNSHVDQWEKDGVIDPTRNPTVYQPQPGR